MDIHRMWHNFSNGDFSTPTQPPSPPSTPESPPPPLGPTPGYGASDFFRPISIATLVITVTVSTVVVAARIYTRRVISRQFGIEDYICILAWACFVVYSTVVAVIGLRHNGGVSSFILTPMQQQDYNRWMNILQTVYGPAMASTKTAILTLYLRFFVSRRSGLLFFTIVGTLLVICGFYFAVTVAKIWECVPREKIFDKSIPGRCVNIHQVLLITASFNLFTDFFIWALPLYKLWKMRIKSSKKSGAATIFLFGLLAPVVSSVRLSKTIEWIRSEDPMFTMYQLALWTVAEISIGVICACLPVFPRLYKTIMRSFRNWVASHQRPDSSYAWSAGPAALSPTARSKQPQKSVVWVTASPSSRRSPGKKSTKQSTKQSSNHSGRSNGKGHSQARESAPSDLQKPLPSLNVDKALPSLPSMVSLDSVGGLRVPRTMMGPRDPEWYEYDEERSVKGLTELDGHKPLASPKARRNARFFPDEEEEVVDL